MNPGPKRLQSAFVDPWNPSEFWRVGREAPTCKSRLNIEEQSRGGTYKHTAEVDFCELPSQTLEPDYRLADHLSDNAGYGS